jgi:hypothetical protein
MERANGARRQSAAVICQDQKARMVLQFIALFFG